jgi:hypothetical protein
LISLSVIWPPRLLRPSLRFRLRLGLKKIQSQRKGARFKEATGLESIGLEASRRMKRFPSTESSSRLCPNLLKMKKLMFTKDIKTALTRKRLRVLALP